jgi:hypothetical protein
MFIIRILILIMLAVFAVYAAETYAFETSNNEARETTKTEALDPVCKGKVFTAKGHRNWAEEFKNSYSIPKKAQAKHLDMVKCAAGRNHQKVMVKNWKKIKKSVLPDNHDLWVAIGRCEQPGSGYKGINWSHTGPTYQGGLGFWYGTWSGYKYPNMPSNAGYASWRQQMKVANRLLAMYGTSPWGCA